MLHLFVIFIDQESVIAKFHNLLIFFLRNPFYCPAGSHCTKKWNILRTNGKNWFDQSGILFALCQHGKLHCSQSATQTANISHSTPASFQKEQHIRPADFCHAAAEKPRRLNTSTIYSKCTRCGAVCVAQLGLQVGRQKAGKERFAAHRMLVMRRLLLLLISQQQSWMARQKACNRNPLIVPLLCWPRACDSPSRNTHQHAHIIHRAMTARMVHPAHSGPHI